MSMVKLAVVKRPIAVRGAAMFCPSCGAGNADGSAFCAKCGNSLTAPVAQSLDATKPNPEPALASRESTPHGSGDAKSAKADVKASKAKAKALRPWYKKKRFWLLGIVAVIIIVSVSNSGKSGTRGSNATPTTPADSSKAALTSYFKQVNSDLNSLRRRYRDHADLTWVRAQIHRDLDRLREPLHRGQAGRGSL